MTKTINGDSVYIVALKAKLKAEGELRDIQAPPHLSKARNNPTQTTMSLRRRAQELEKIVERSERFLVACKGGK